MTAIKKLIPHLFTAGNLVGGILAIILTLNGRIDLAPYCIFGSAFLDFLDGFVARLLGVQGELGKQLDSLADMVTFGVAPGIIVFEMLKYSSWIDYDSLTIGFKILPLAGLIIPVFAMFRLAKFNLDTNQSDSFIGLPTPAMTIFIAALPLMISDGINSQGLYFELATKILVQPFFLLSIAILLSILMVAPLPLFALKFKSFGWKGNEVRYSFLTISAVLLATLFWWALPAIIILYLLLSVVIQLTKKSTNDEVHS